MIKAVGVERYLALSGAVRVHEDETGVLWKRSFPVTNAADVRRPLRSLCFVEVLNGTIEPDGTRKRYFLRVPPGMLTARAAVAWSYGLSERDYVPLART